MPEPKERPETPKPIRDAQYIQTLAHAIIGDMEPEKDDLPPELYDRVIGWAEDIGRLSISIRNDLLTGLPQAKKRRAAREKAAALSPEEEELLHPDNAMYE